MKWEWGENPQLSRSCKFFYAGKQKATAYFDGKALEGGTKSEDLPYDSHPTSRSKRKRFRDNYFFTKHSSPIGVKMLGLLSDDKIVRVLLYKLFFKMSGA